MLDVIKTTLVNLFISLTASAAFAPIMIGILYKFDQVVEVKATKQGIGGGTNALFRKIMNVDKTNGTPNMGGILILIAVPIVSLLLLELTPLLKVLLVGFVTFGIWGLIDVLFTNSIKGNEKLKVLQETFEWRLGKLFIAILLNCVVTYLIYKTGLLGSIVLWKGMLISFVPLLIPVIAIVGQFAIYANELTDGEDGLMIGIMGIIFATIGALLLLQGKFEFIPFIGIAIGSIIVDLYFNIPPARFWNGGPGAMPLGYAAFFICLVTGNIIPYFIITSITWGIFASSFIQIISMKFFHRRVFKIAPIHHHFKALGWPNYKVVMRFWLFTVFTAILGILVGLVIL
ncbi:hypothetical protein M0R04_00080 [Candidatus Dojkabacteria bacterium]|jgi:phospho-N-acetylmuramoyl-pentapeptide-transferase|nr:hypothetical protein [Candidatus Dojkabacteria bacterium]